MVGAHAWFVLLHCSSPIPPPRLYAKYRDPDNLHDRASDTTVLIRLHHTYRDFSRHRSCIPHTPLVELILRMTFPITLAIIMRRDVPA